MSQQLEANAALSEDSSALSSGPQSKWLTTMCKLRGRGSEVTHTYTNIHTHDHQNIEANVKNALSSS